MREQQDSRQDWKSAPCRSRVDKDVLISGCRCRTPERRVRTRSAVWEYRATDVCAQTGERCSGTRCSNRFPRGIMKTTGKGSMQVTLTAACLGALSAGLVTDIPYEPVPRRYPIRAGGGPDLIARAIAPRWERNSSSRSSWRIAVERAARSGLQLVARAAARRLIPFMITMAGTQILSMFAFKSLALTTL